MIRFVAPDPVLAGHYPSSSGQVRGHRVRWVFAMLLAALLIVVPGEAVHADDDDDVIFEINQILTSSGRLELPIETRRLDLIGYYGGRAFKPLFTGTDRIDGLLRRMRDAALDGLDPADYPADFLQEQRSVAQDGGAAEKARAELWFAVHFLRFAADMKTGRVVPKKLYPDGFLPAKTIDDANVLMALERFDDMDEFFLAWEPAVPGYRGLREALPRYLAIRRDGGWPKVAGALTRGDQSEDVGVLFTRLAMEDDVLAAERGDATMFGDALEQALRRFQARYGLVETGTVNTETRMALNVDVSWRIDQIVLSLERLRWLPERFARNSLVIDKARGTASLVGMDDAQAEWKVYPNCPRQNPVVGTGTLRSLTVNPFWEVPYSYFATELLPRLRADAKAVEDEGYTLFMSNVPQPIAGWPWRSMSDDFIRQRREEFRLRLTPGTANPLGDYLYALRDTDQVFLFAADSPPGGELCDPRLPATAFALTRGMELAPRVLDPRVAAPDQLSELRQRGEPVTFPSDGTTQVIIVFRSAWADDDGAVHFGFDAYLEDRRLKEALGARLVPD